MFPDLLTGFQGGLFGWLTLNPRGGGEPCWIGSWNQRGGGGVSQLASCHQYLLEWVLEKKEDLERQVFEIFGVNRDRHVFCLLSADCLWGRGRGVIRCRLWLMII